MGIIKRLSLKRGFVAFVDYFGRFSTSNLGGHIRKLILPPKFESKIGSKEPQNRQKLFSTTVSKTPFFFLLLFFAIDISAKCSEVPESVRNKYASDMFQAFAIQSYGKSTAAFCQFEIAREEAKKAGENVLKLIAIEKLFAWYRMYGTSLKLFYQNPTGHDRIQGEYKSHTKRLNSNYNYQSEWGNNPEQARLIREFMFGVGEIIAGVFCVTVSGGIFSTIAWGVAIDGGNRIYSSLNSLWAQHQTELLALKNWEKTALKPALE